MSPYMCATQDNEHKIGYLSKELELLKNYDISWEDWNRSTVGKY